MDSDECGRWWRELCVVSVGMDGEGGRGSGGGGGDDDGGGGGGGGELLPAVAAAVAS